MSEHLITSVEMARFGASGYLKYEEIIPRDLSAACRQEMESHSGYLAVGRPFEET